MSDIVPSNENKEIIKEDSNEEVEDLLEFMEKIAPGGKQVVPLCKVCASPSRDEAEKLKAEGWSNKRIFEWFSEKHKEENIGYSSVNNHMNNHYGVVNENEQIKNYAFEITKWKKLSKNEKNLYPRYITMLDREASLLLSQKDADGKQITLSDRRKNIEMATKIIDMVKSLKKELREIEKEKKPIEMIITSISRIIEIKVKSYNSPEVRQVLKEIIEELNKDIGELKIEEGE